MKNKEKLISNRREERSLIRTLKCLCKDYEKYKDYALFSNLDSDTEYTREAYRGRCNKIIEMIFYILNDFELPLLNSWWHSRLKSRIEEIAKVGA